jgi:hypothetical protein
MSTKLFLLSRAAAVAGILALALPATAATTQPVSPASTTPSVSAPISKDGKTVVHAKKKHATKPVHKVAATTKPITAMPVAKTPAPAAPANTDAGKSPATSK